MSKPSIRLVVAALLVAVALVGCGGRAGRLGGSSAGSSAEPTSEVVWRGPSASPALPSPAATTPVTPASPAPSMPPVTPPADPVPTPHLASIERLLDAIDAALADEAEAASQEGSTP